jgi:uncharacterized alpha-E superfamily protein
MLARIAHELYWIGRYVSRAEHNARMLDGVFRINLQARRGLGGDEMPWEAVMAVMGAAPPEGNGSVEATDAVHRLTLDPDTDASVTSCVEGAREGAKKVRDVVSREMWEALNTLYLELDASDLRSALRTGPYSIYAFVRERCALWWGLAEETMLRDEAHAFLTAGRHVEGASMMLRMLRVSLIPAAVKAGPDGLGGGGAPAIALLNAVGGLEAFRRSVASTATADQVARFLIFEPTYPHSLTASMNLLFERLEEIDHRSAAPLLRLARLRAELEFSGGAPAIDGEPDAEALPLAPLLEHIQAELELVDAEIERRYFTGGAGIAQVVTG